MSLYRNYLTGERSTQRRSGVGSQRYVPSHPYGPAQHPSSRREILGRAFPGDTGAQRTPTKYMFLGLELGSLSHRGML